MTIAYPLGNRVVYKAGAEEEIIEKIKGISDVVRRRWTFEDEKSLGDGMIEATLKQNEDEVWPDTVFSDEEETGNEREIAVILDLFEKGSWVSYVTEHKFDLDYMYHLEKKVVKGEAVILMKTANIFSAMRRYDWSSIPVDSKLDLKTEESLDEE